MTRLLRYPFSIYQKICEAFYRHGLSNGDILMFHQVSDNTKIWRDPECCITERAFLDLFSKLKKLPVSYGALPDLFSSVECQGEKRVFVSFDDAFEDVYTVAMPILMKYNIPFTVFVTIELINQPGYISSSMLQELADCPICTIGAHAISHRMLRWMKGKESRREIVGSGEFLEQLSGREITLFAYPYGSVFACSRKNIRQVKESGYQMAFSTINSGLSSRTTKNRFFLPRRNINEQNYLTFLGGIEHD